MDPPSNIKKVIIYDTNKNVEEEDEDECEQEQEAYIYKTLLNQNNHDIMSYTKQDIKNDKNDILQKLGLRGEEVKVFHKKLKDYRYIHDVHEVKHGSYARWINLKNKNVKLTNGGVIVKVIYDDKKNTGTVTIRNNMNRFISISFMNVLFFQKLTEQEDFLLNVIKYVK
jgi:phosphoribosyl-ATP pyrophosphohydrolase